MNSKLLISKPIINKIYEDIYQKINKLNYIIGLAVILIGNREDSISYIKMKQKKCKELGIESYLFHFNETITENIIIEKIQELNNDNKIHGILIQLPLPQHTNGNKIIHSIDYKKDVDGFHFINMGKLTINSKPLFIPCTPLGCFELLKYYNIPIKGKHIVIIGSSIVVGLPLSLLLLHNGATPTLCNINTENIKLISKTADILIVCCGVPKLINNEWIKKDCIIIDIGFNKIDGKIIGDVDFENVIHKVKYITPVPGGIGPMTIAMLIKNTIKDI